MALLTDIFPKQIIVTGTTDNVKDYLDQVPEIKAWYRSSYYRIGANSFANLVDVSGKGEIGTGSASINASNEIVFNGSSNIIDLPMGLFSSSNELEFFLKLKFNSLPAANNFCLSCYGGLSPSRFYVGHNSDKLYLAHGSGLSTNFSGNLSPNFTVNTNDYYIINGRVLTTNPRYTVVVNNQFSFTTNTTLTDSFSGGNFVLGAFRAGATISNRTNFSLKEAIFCSPLTQQKRDLLYSFCNNN